MLEGHWCALGWPLWTPKGELGMRWWLSCRTDYAATATVLLHSQQSKGKRGGGKTRGVWSHRLLLELEFELCELLLDEDEEELDEDEEELDEDGSEAAAGRGAGRGRQRGQKTGGPKNASAWYKGQNQEA